MGSNFHPRWERWDPAIPTWDPGWDCWDSTYIPPDILLGCKHKEISGVCPKLFISLAYILSSCSTEVKQEEKSGSAAKKRKVDAVEEPVTSGVSSTSKTRKFKGKDKRKITF